MAVSPEKGTYPLENKEKIEIGGIKVKLRIATFGTCSYAMVRTLDPIHPSIKFMADEIVEDRNQELPERALRDVASRTAIVTGAENTPEVEILPPPSDKSTENEKIAETFMCLKNWKPIYQRM
ncbi:hypothetical protein O3M35_012105 [Rhynocoris fuscipes]|uniref:Uncharacterized protein n=1 Tax=Rhynocoris fuscipes TaxID=488301 RepID=A0AAW1CYK2_9HEMI